MTGEEEGEHYHHQPSAAATLAKSPEGGSKVIPLRELSFTIHITIDGEVHELPMPGTIECQSDDEEQHPQQPQHGLVTRKHKRKKCGRHRSRSRRPWIRKHHHRPATAPEGASAAGRGRPSQPGEEDISYIPPRSGISPHKRKNLLLGRIEDITKLCRRSGLKGLSDTTTPEAYAQQYLGLRFDISNDDDDRGMLVIVSAVLDWLEEPLSSPWHFHVQLGDTPDSPSTLFFVHDGLRDVINLHPDHLPLMRLIEFYLCASQRYNNSKREAMDAPPHPVGEAPHSYSSSVITLLERTIRRVHIRAERFIRDIKQWEGISRHWRYWADFQDEYADDHSEEVQHLGLKEITLIEDEVCRQRDRLVLGMQQIVARLGAWKLESGSNQEEEDSGFGSKPGMAALTKVVAVTAWDAKRKSNASVASNADDTAKQEEGVDGGRMSIAEENWGALGAKGWLRATYQAVKASECSEDDISSEEDEKGLPIEEKRFKKLTRKLKLDTIAAGMISAAFNSLVSEGSRSIDKNAYIQLCRRCILNRVGKHDSVDSVITEWFEEVDTDTDGRVTLKDILRWYKKFTLHRGNVVKSVLNKQQEQVKGVRKRNMIKQAMAPKKVQAIEDIIKRQQEEAEQIQQEKQQQQAAAAAAVSVDKSSEARKGSVRSSLGEGKKIAGLSKLKSQRTVRMEVSDNAPERTVSEEKKSVSSYRWLQSSATLGSLSCDTNSEAAASSSRAPSVNSHTDLYDDDQDEPVVRGSSRDIELYHQQQRDIADELKKIAGYSQKQGSMASFLAAVAATGSVKHVVMRPVDKRLVEAVKAGKKLPRPKSRESKVLLKRKPDALRPLAQVCSQKRLVESSLIPTKHDTGNISVIVYTNFAVVVKRFMIDCLFLLNPYGEEITSKVYRRRHHSLASYRKLVRTLFNKRDKCPTNLYGIVHASKVDTDGNDSTPCVLIYIYREYIYLAAVVSTDVSALLLFDILDTVYSVLLHYCSAALASSSLVGHRYPRVDEELLRDNFSTVAILLDEIIDGPGLPFTTNKANLEAMLPPPTMLGKFIAAVAGTSAKMASDRRNEVVAPQQPSPNLSLGVAPSNTTTSSFLASAMSSVMTGVTNAMAASSGALVNAANNRDTSATTIDIGGEYWWRPNSPHYTHNELYVDVVETFNCIVDDEGYVVDADVAGDVSVISKLNGLSPHATLNIRNIDIITSIVHFHPSVDVNKWYKDRKVSFVPADGRYSLCNYHTPFSRAQASGRLPIQLDLKMSFDRSGGRIDFTARPRVSAVLNTRATMLSRNNRGPHQQQHPSIVVDDVIVSIALPSSVSSGNLNTFMKSRTDHKSSPSIHIDNTPDGGCVLVWHVGQLVSNAAGGEDTVVAASGTLSYRSGTSPALSTDIANEQRCVAQVGFMIRGWCISGLRLDSLDITNIEGSTPPPQKGCRYSTVAGLMDVRVA
ncbi:AP-3 complex subunit mu-2 [Perkinsus chesapeaki]|uniref:AP-3 complex subunit mu-2 n=1 Tax=Perkinsus chesapeaki TaxID=330153 RepID=A0A7J6MQJ8_PERCH|nr:AP-3 complex subunit mu-2 [Perkinsus chesapeaki]